MHFVGGAPKVGVEVLSTLPSAHLAMVIAKVSQSSISKASTHSMVNGGLVANSLPSQTMIA